MYPGHEVKNSCMLQEEEEVNCSDFGDTSASVQELCAAPYVGAGAFPAD